MAKNNYKNYKAHEKELVAIKDFSNSYFDLIDSELEFIKRYSDSGSSLKGGMVQESVSSLNGAIDLIGSKSTRANNLAQKMMGQYYAEVTKLMASDKYWSAYDLFRKIEITHLPDSQKNIRDNFYKDLKKSHLESQLKKARSLESSKNYFGALAQLHELLEGDVFSCNDVATHMKTLQSKITVSSIDSDDKAKKYFACRVRDGSEFYKSSIKPDEYKGGYFLIFAKLEESVGTGMYHGYHGQLEFIVRIDNPKQAGYLLSGKAFSLYLESDGVVPVSRAKSGGKVTLPLYKVLWVNSN